MANLDASQSGIQAPSGGFQQGGWYWDKLANGARQYQNGSFGDAGSIHPESNQPGAGQPVSNAFKPSTPPLTTANPTTNNTPSTNDTPQPNTSTKDGSVFTPPPNTSTLSGQVNTPPANQSLSDHPTAVQASTQAIQHGADPSIVERARKFLNTPDFIGFCQAFVENVTQGREGIYQSAMDAWNKQQKNAQTNLANMKPGDSIYFNADSSNGYNGHTGVYVGNGQFISATNNGIKQMSLADWAKATGQKILGYIANSGQPGGAVGSGIADAVAPMIGNAVSGAEKKAGEVAKNVGNWASSMFAPQAQAATIPNQALNNNVLPSGTPNWIQDTILKAAEKYNVPPSILASVAAHESGGSWNPRQKQIGGGMGRGIFQIDLGQHAITEEQAFDPKFAADFAAKLLKEGFDKTGSWSDALRYYNGGPGFDSNKVGYGGNTVNYNTNSYADKVASKMSKLSPVIQKQANKMLKDLPKKKEEAKNNLDSKFPLIKDLMNGMPLG